jgi:hypothetical protein
MFHSIAGRHFAITSAWRLKNIRQQFFETSRQH